MVRIQLELPDEQVAALDDLMRKTQTRTRKDLFNNALTLFEWAVKEKMQRRRVASIDESQEIFKELVMPALENVIVEEEVGASSSTGSVAKGRAR